MEGAGADFHVVGLQQRAALAVPERVQLQDELLEGQHGGRGFYRLQPAPRDERARREQREREQRATGQSPQRTYGVAPA